MLVLLAGMLLLKGKHYLWFSFGCLAVSILPAYWHFEKREMSTRLLVFLAVIVALGVLGRVPLAAIPNVQLTSFVVIVSAVSLGPEMGFVSGSMMALVSNLFLGQGPWTPWQMLAWGLMGLTTGLLRRSQLKDNVWLLVVWGALWGFWFGWIMDLWYALAYVRPLRVTSFLLAFAGSFLFDALHAATNAVSILLLYRPWRQLMDRLITKYQILPKSMTSGQRHHR
ncbi:ECF transporter S component [Levilactobacillus koreensis]|uniref:Membrane protein n=1 Tax=Levilactobacillus koreensis TaxID=637971 RepID=A0AAC8UYN9_9LACO|nr:ECF transporter S component [Levilactobacillus koreensis]AKP66070.1 membrane protein [Levilactobacillus koreensis]